MPDAVPALSAPTIERDNPLTRSKAGVVGIAFLACMLALCLGRLPWTLGAGAERGVPRYNEGKPAAGRLPPLWISPSADQARRFNQLVDPGVVGEIAHANNIKPSDAIEATTGPA